MIYFSPSLFLSLSRVSPIGSDSGSGEIRGRRGRETVGEAQYERMGGAERDESA